MATLHWRGSKADLLRTLRSLPAILAGKAPDPWGVHDLFWGWVGNATLALIQRDFLTKLHGGRGLDGVKWAQLAVATLARRRRQGRDDEDILYETGSLLGSLEPGPEMFPSSDAPDQIFEIFRGGVEVGTADRTADRHQYGTEYMPARPIAPTGEPAFEWERVVESACADAVVKCLERITDLGPF